MQVKNDTKIVIFGKNQFFDKTGKIPQTLWNFIGFCHLSL
jgi:hypothetical protein